MTMMAAAMVMIPAGLSKKSIFILLIFGDIIDT
jgi:hypothetical protein